MTFKVLAVLLFFQLMHVGLLAQQVVQLKGNSYTIHQVAAGETFYAIAKTYAVLLDSIKQVNRMDSAATIRPGDLLIIPLHASQKPDAGKVVTKINNDYLIHVVKTGETLYSIARNYSYTTVATLKEINNLLSDTVQIGQQLLVPKPNDSGMIRPNRDTVSLSGVKTVMIGVDSAALFDPGKLRFSMESMLANNVDMDDEPIDEPTFDMEMLEELKQTFEAEAAQDNIEVSKGAATWFDDPSAQNQSKFYALHKSAPMGSVMMVRNLMNNRKVYVKVIGRLPENADNRNVLIKISGATAKYLNVLDDKFLVELTEHPSKS